MPTNKKYLSLSIEEFDSYLQPVFELFSKVSQNTAIDIASVGEPIDIASFEAMIDVSPADEDRKFSHSPPLTIEPSKS